MLREVLLALLGHTGDIIVDAAQRGYGTEGFVVNRDFDLLTEPELEQTNQVVALGFEYRELSNFASRHQIFRATKALYVGAVALAVTEVLREYAEHVCKVEAEVLREETSLSYVVQQLQKWFVVLPGLQRIVAQIERRTIHGTQLLDFMSQQAMSGLPVMQQVCQRILQRLRIVFLNQLLSWMLHGALLDPAGEFFIRSGTQPLDTSNAASASNARMTTPTRKVPTIPTSQRGVSVLDSPTIGHSPMPGGVTDAYLDDADVLDALQLGDEETNAPVSSTRSLVEWNTSYTLRLLMIPASHLNATLASKVLFTGKAVRLLKSVQARNDAKAATQLSRHASRRSMNTDDFDDMTVRDTDEFSRSSDNDTSVFHEFSDDELESIDSDEEDAGFPAAELEEQDLRSFYAYFGSGQFQSRRGKKKTRVRARFQRPSSSSQAIRDRPARISSARSVSSMSGVTGYGNERPSRGLHVRSRSEPRLQAIGEDDIDDLQFDFQQSELTGFMKQFHDMFGNPNLRSTDLEELLNAIHDVVAKKLYNMLLQKDGLLQHVAVARNLFLLGKGELFHALIETTQSNVLRNAPGSFADSELNQVCLRRCLKLIGLDEDVFLSRIQLHINPPAAKKEEIWSQHDIVLTGNCKLVRETRAAQFSSPPMSSPFGSPRVTTAAADAGGLWLLDQKSVGQGFSASCVFSVAANQLTRRRAAPVAPTATFAFCVHNHRRSCVGSAGLEHAGCRDIPNSLSVLCELFDEASHWRVNIKIVCDPHSSTKNTTFRISSVPASRTGGQLPQVQQLAEATGLLVPKKSAAHALRLQVEYARDVRYAASRSITDMSSTTEIREGSQAHYSLFARIKPADDVENAGETHHLDGSKLYAQKWDVEAEVNIASFLRLDGGKAFVGWSCGWESPGSFASLELQSFVFASRMPFNSRLGPSSYTFTRLPELATSIQNYITNHRAWSDISIRYKFPHAMTLVFDEETVAQYNRMFAYLMEIQRVSFDLDRIWPVLMLLKKKSKARDATGYKLQQLLGLRQKMAFFVNNLLYYLQIDVIDAEHKTLIERVGEVSDFDSVVKAHKLFLANIKHQSYLEFPQVQDCIQRVLQVCMRYCAFFAQRSRGSILSDGAIVDAVSETAWEDVPQEEVDAAGSDFESEVSHLFLLLQRIETRGFLFRLDFNGHYSATAAQLNASRRSKTRSVSPPPERGLRREESHSKLSEASSFLFQPPS